MLEKSAFFYERLLPRFAPLPLAEPKSDDVCRRMDRWRHNTALGDDGAASVLGLISSLLGHISRRPLRHPTGPEHQALARTPPATCASSESDSSPDAAPESGSTTVRLAPALSTNRSLKPGGSGRGLT